MEYVRFTVPVTPAGSVTVTAKVSPIFTDLALKAMIMLSACACTSGVMIQLIRNTSASTTPSIRFPFALLFCLICSAFLLLPNGDLPLKMFVQIYQIKHIDPVFFAVCICGLKITSGKLLGTIQMPV